MTSPGHPPAHSGVSGRGGAPALRDSLGEDPTLPDRLLPICSPSGEPLTLLVLRAWCSGPRPQGPSQRRAVATRPLLPAGLAGWAAGRSAASH